MPRGNSSRRNMDQPPDREMESLLQEHFDDEGPNLRSPKDPWEWLQSRMEEPDRPSLLSRLLNGLGGMRERRPGTAFAAAGAAAVILVAAVIIWSVAGDGGPGDDPGGLVAVAPTAAATAAHTPAPMIAPTAAPTMAPTAATMAPTPVSTMAPTAAAPRATAMPAATPRATAATTPAPTMALTAAPRPTQAQPRGTPPATDFQDYARERFVSATVDNVSTFSLDTDRTSYFLALNWAKNGYEVDPDSVRAEEWINAFNYGYEQPRRDDSFAVYSDVVTHPLDSRMHLARIAFQAPEFDYDATPVNVTLVLDASGSMANGNRVDIAREAAESIRQSLRDHDRIAVVHFSENVLSQYTVKHRHPDDSDVARSINRLIPSGSTNVQAGLDRGVQLADWARRDNPKAYNYIILMSDGVANVDATDPFAILESVGDYDSSNPLRLITIGVGIENFNDYLLEQLAQHGNGWYRYLSDIDQARATFSRENWLALSIPFADQTRAQVTWDPDVVSSWRIVGYENRITSDESFTQARKEFAEIPAGAATTVFYELELRDPRFSGPLTLGDVELRWVTPATGESNRQHTSITGQDNVDFYYADPLLRLGAVIALSSDRYSSLPYADSSDPSVHQDMLYLLDQFRSLEGSLGNLGAYRDLAFLLEHVSIGKDQEVSLQWSTSAQDPSNLVVDEDNIYLISGHISDAKVYALNKRTGRVLWIHDMDASLGDRNWWDGNVVVGPFVQNDTILVSYAPRYLDALQASTGDPKWRFELDHLDTQNPIFASDYIFSSTLNQNGSGDRKSKIYSLNPETGTTNWEIEMVGWFLHKRPIIEYKGSIYFSFVEEGGTSIYSFDAGTGEFNWRYEVWGDSLVAANDSIYFTGGGGVASLDAKSGNLNWKTRFDTAGRVPRLAVSRNSIYFCAAGFMYSLDALSGKLKWQNQLESKCPRDQTNVPVISDEALFFGTMERSGAFHSFDAETGESNWKKMSRSAGDTLGQAHGGRVYFSLNGNLAAANSSTGELIWTYNTEGSPVSSIVLSEGILYTTAGDRIFAIRVSK